MKNFWIILTAVLLVVTFGACKDAQNISGTTVPEQENSQILEETTVSGDWNLETTEPDSPELTTVALLPETTEPDSPEQTTEALQPETTESDGPEQTTEALQPETTVDIFEDEPELDYSDFEELETTEDRRPTAPKPESDLEDGSQTVSTTEPFQTEEKVTEPLCTESRPTVPPQTEQPTVQTTTETTLDIFQDEPELDFSDIPDVEVLVTAPVTLPQLEEILPELTVPKYTWPEERPARPLVTLPQQIPEEPVWSEPLVPEFSAPALPEFTIPDLPEQPETTQARQDPIVLPTLPAATEIVTEPTENLETMAPAATTMPAETIPPVTTEPEETVPLTTAAPSYGPDGYNNQVVRP